MKSLSTCKKYSFFTGCNSTDAFFKAKVLKNVNEDSNNRFQAVVTCILDLYGATTKIRCVLLSSLPPTSDAAFEHLKSLTTNPDMNQLLGMVNLVQMLFFKSKRNMPDVRREACTVI